MIFIVFDSIFLTIFEKHNNILIENFQFVVPSTITATMTEKSMFSKKSLQFDCSTDSSVYYDTKTSISNLSKNNAPKIGAMLMGFVALGVTLQYIVLLSKYRLARAWAGSLPSASSFHNQTDA